METQSLPTTLDALQFIRNACDFDVLMFFHRHPCVLMTTEELASHVGYRPERVQESLDALIESGLLIQSRTPSRTARMLALELSGAPGRQISPILTIAATREGRQGVMRLLGSARDRVRSEGLAPARALQPQSSMA